MSDLFDRCIDLEFYGAGGELMLTLKTPEFGAKPAIAVKGKMVNLDLSVSCEVTVTNLLDSFAINDVEQIVAKLYYRGAQTATTAGMASGATVNYTVLYADETKQPPDRQVTFKCITSGLNKSVVGIAYDRAGADATDDSGTYPEIQLSELLKDWISKYKSALRSLPKPPEIADDPIVAVPEATYNTLKLADAPMHTTLWGALVAWEQALREDKEVTDDTGQSKSVVWYPYTFALTEEGLTVLDNPDPTAEEQSGLTAGKQQELDYVISAFRNGNVAHIQCMYLPNLRVGNVVKIHSTALLGKRAAGTLVTNLKNNPVYVKILGGSTYEFGTVQGNKMDLLGIILT